MKLYVQEKVKWKYKKDDAEFTDVVTLTSKCHNTAKLIQKKYKTKRAIIVLHTEILNMGYSL